MINTNIKKRILAVSLFGWIVFGISQMVYADQADEFPTGLPEMTQEELEWQNKHMLKVKKVHLNEVGLNRINQWREKQGKKRIEKVVKSVSKPGSDLEVTIGAEPNYDDSDLEKIDLPAGIDNSFSKFFPPIRSQGSLNSCGAFSGVYYTMTYMHAMANNLDAKSGGDDMRLSPKWAYNMLNYGKNTGIWYYWAYEVGQKHGVATWSEFPYNSNYREWSLNQDTWEDAIYRRFDQYGYVSNTNLDSGIEQVKLMILNGYVLNIPTYIRSWQYQTIKDDPSTTQDDALVGRKCVAWVNGTSGYHAMTVVGYNDDIWVDINNNGVVDSGEKGAFRIANSWGTGWGEGGFVWMSYDALKRPSAVVGGPSDGRIYGWYPARAHWITARKDYSPRYIGKFTLNHNKRNHLRITLGVSENGGDEPTTTWTPEMIYNHAGSYAFDGTTTAVDGTFIFDFTDIVPTGGGDFVCYLGVQDDTAGDEASLKSFSITDVEKGYMQYNSVDIPLTVDGDQVYASAEVSTVDENTLPSAMINVPEINGTAPFIVTFSGKDSFDHDGSIVSYQWDFGDGHYMTGMDVTHTYETVGHYTASLTITDDRGARDTADVVIDVTSAEESKILYVSAMTAELNEEPNTANSIVTIIVSDTEGNPVSGATVDVRWVGVVFNSDSGVTGTDGSVTFVSDKTTSSGTISLILADVSAPDYEWDSSMDSVSIASVESSASTRKVEKAISRLVKKSSISKRRRR